MAVGVTIDKVEYVGRWDYQPPIVDKPWILMSVYYTCTALAPMTKKSAKIKYHIELTHSRGVEGISAEVVLPIEPQPKLFVTSTGKFNISVVYNKNVTSNEKIHVKYTITTEYPIGPFGKCMIPHVVEGEFEC